MSKLNYTPEVREFLRLLDSYGGPVTASRIYQDAGEEVESLLMGCKEDGLVAYQDGDPGGWVVTDLGRAVISKGADV